MSKRSALALVCSLLGSIFSLNGQALAVSSPPEHAGTLDVMPVRDFCGLGLHRSAYGYCVPNGTPYVYAPPVVVAPLVVARACPYGYHLGPYGRCTRG